jgi:MtN3 and saliva related transmembrane protein
MDIWQIVAFFAALSGTTSLIPEVIKAFRTGLLRDISWGMLAILLAASSCWAIYGLSLGEIPLMVSAGVNVFMEIMLIYLKIKYELKSHPDFSWKNTLMKKSPILQSILQKIN